MSTENIRLKIPLLVESLRVEIMDQNKLVVEHGSLTSELGEPFRIFSKFVRVFDLYFVATPRVPDDKLLHGSKILHQYIDNDGDSFPDNSLVYSQLVR